MHNIFQGKNDKNYVNMKTYLNDTIEIQTQSRVLIGQLTMMRGNQVGANFSEVAPEDSGLRPKKYNHTLLYPAKLIFWIPRQ